MITGTGPAASAGVDRLNLMSTVTCGYEVLSTWPTMFFVTIATYPFFSGVLESTSHATLGVTLGMRP
jgi:hypothetical protein